jgi:soluble lytic murein transglycosylase-like protein
METETDLTQSRLQGILRRTNGPLSGTQHRMLGNVLRVGRDSSNDLTVEGPEASIVSSRHLEIRRDGSLFRLVDLGSTNGTFVDGKRVSEIALQNHARITLGPGGPEFQFEIGTSADARFDQTIRLTEVPDQLPAPPVGTVSVVMGSVTANRQQEELIKEAVKRARQARRVGVGGQTGIIMREMLDKALHRSSKKFKFTIGLLAAALLSVSTYSAWTIQKLRRDQNQIDSQIVRIEHELQTAGDDPKRVDELLERLNGYQEQALKMQKNLLYRLGVRSKEQDFIESEIQQLMKEFGAEEYSIPKEFTQQVRRFIRQYQERDRAHLERALGRSRKELEAVRKQLKADNLPPDLAYMVLVESAFIAGSSSSAGAAGLWQFTPTTARAYGLKVGDGRDERLDTRKSTQAAGLYIRELIFDFGSGSSMMLALAAYNLGPGKVKRAVRTVEDPIKQRNFWYLYRTKALPAETREYIPKTIAAIIIGRNPQKFGFS